MNEGGSTFLPGTVSAPGWAVSGDTDTGLFQAASTPNTLSIAVGGGEVARFDGGNALTVNYFDFYSYQSGYPLNIVASGSDTDISIDITPKGGGHTSINSWLGVNDFGNAYAPLDVNGGTASGSWLQIANIYADIDTGGLVYFTIENVNATDHEAALVVGNWWIGNSSNADTNDDFFINQGGFGRVFGITTNRNISLPANDYINFNFTDGSGGYGFNDSSGTLKFKNSGGSWAAFAAASDRRLKRDIVDLSENDGLAAILKLQPVRFHWKDVQQDNDEGEQIGLIAQDVEKVFPVGVTGNYGDAVVHLGNGTEETVRQARKLDYGRLVSPIIKSIQQLSGKFEHLIANPVVGSPSHPSGITLYDDVTGEPYCARMHAGELVHAKGVCANGPGRTTVMARPSGDSGAMNGR
jgi:Chaperone of endosialidase